jgi:hypothetical protein
MSAYGFDTVRDYFSEKRFKGDEIFTFAVFLFVGICLIYAGVIIIQTETIFKDIYEGFITTISFSASTATATCSPGNTKYSATFAGTTNYGCITNCASGEALYYPGNGGPVIGTILDPTKITMAQVQSSNFNTENGLHCRASIFTGELPKDLTIGQLNKNVKLIRKKSDLNLTVAAGMIISGSILIMYQTYRLFF